MDIVLANGGTAVELNNIYPNWFTQGGIMPYKKLLILTSLTIVLVAFVFLTRPSQAETTGLANTMNTLKLTYPGVTFYSSERTPILLAGNSGAHVIWEEEVALPN